MASKEITPEQLQMLEELVARARRVQPFIEGYTQVRVDRMCQAVAWAAGNPEDFQRLCWMGVSLVESRWKGLPCRSAVSKI